MTKATKAIRQQTMKDARKAASDKAHRQELEKNEKRAAAEAQINLHRPLQPMLEEILPAIIQALEKAGWPDGELAWFRCYWIVPRRMAFWTIRRDIKEADIIFREDGRIFTTWPGFFPWTWKCRRVVPGSDHERDLNALQALYFWEASKEIVQETYKNRLLQGLILKELQEKLSYIHLP